MMSPEERVQFRAEAATALDSHENRTDGVRVAQALGDGLKTLRDLFFSRVHRDVEQAFGVDSMLAPIAQMRTEDAAKTEIDLYQITESAAHAHAQRYVHTDDDWCLKWLGRLRLGAAVDAPEMAHRLSRYAAKGPDDRRRSFSVMLERTLPDARRAPLILYRLLPLAVAIATDLAFNNHAGAAEMRKRQIALLPGIRDCHHCHGAVLDVAEKCQQCGNPMWKHDWLTAD
ncbi:MAG: hypothetical protein HY000_10940 [Planctomycetes bacterium]|nr:hypothetical protein [Planctomycetota bacterium]